MIQNAQLKPSVLTAAHFLNSLSRSGSDRSTSLASPTSEGLLIKSTTASSLRVGGGESHENHMTLKTT